MKVIANIGFGIEPGALGKDHPEGDARGRPCQLSLHLSAGQRMAAQQAIRGAIPQALERVSQLCGGGRIHDALSAETCNREGQRSPWCVAGAGTDHQHARGHGDGNAGRLPLHPAAGSLGVQADSRRIQQERARISIPDLGSGPHHRAGRAQRLSPARIGRSRGRPRRSFRDLQLDQDHLADTGRSTPPPKGSLRGRDCRPLTPARSGRVRRSDPCRRRRRSPASI